MQFVIVVDRAGNDLASELLDIAGKTKTSLSNVVVMVSENTVKSDSFAPLKSTPEEQRAFIAVINPRLLEEFYAANSNSIDNQFDSKMVELLLLTLELASGKERPNSPMIIFYDKKKRIVVFLPPADKKRHEELKEHYKGQAKALESA